MKAVYYASDADPWGHSVFTLLRGLKDAGIEENTFTDLVDSAKRLDQHYIPTRSPNGLPGTVPSQAYGRTDADMALDAAGRILEAARDALK